MLVQFRLLLLGVDSAPTSTDAGVDLVAYSAGRAEPVSIQVKTNLKAKPGGGKGKAALDWWVPIDSPAQYMALVDLATEAVWLISKAELAQVVQQKSSGRYHLYMYTDPAAKPRRAGRLAHFHEFDKFLLSRCEERVFG